jgi:hypothetical protein
MWPAIGQCGPGAGEQHRQTQQPLRHPRNLEKEATRIDRGERSKHEAGANRENAAKRKPDRIFSV